jgi:hypothetical protein
MEHSMNTHQTALALCATLLLGCPSSSTSHDAAADKAVADAAEASVDVASCDAPRVTCGAACVNLQWAHSHCGQCGRRCQSYEICDRGQCVRASICPTTCVGDDDCRRCSYEGDPTMFCCLRTAGAAVGRCANIGGCVRQQ